MRRFRGVLSAFLLGYLVAVVPSYRPSLPSPYSTVLYVTKVRNRQRTPSATRAMDEDCRGPLALALVANVATNLDFRDAKMLASTCSHVRSAVRAGPIGLVTDVERIITHEDLASLFGFLRWCGEAVRELRLEQQPRALWGAPYDDGR